MSLPDRGLFAMRCSYRRALASSTVPLFVGATLRVEVDDPTTRPTLTLVAEDTADRQRRRKTWSQNVARHTLPETARVKLDIACREELRRWLKAAPSPDAGVGGAV